MWMKYRLEEENVVNATSHRRAKHIYLDVKRDNTLLMRVEGKQMLIQTSIKSAFLVRC